MFTKTAKLLAVLSVLSTAFAGASLADTIRIGANIGNVPWEFEDKDGQFVGFEVDLVKEIAKRLNKDFEILNVPWTGLFAAIQSDRVDIAISSVTITPERLQSVTFAQPYYDSDQSLTVLASGPRSIAEMGGKVVGVYTGGTGDIWTTEHTAKYKFAEIRRYEGLEPAMLDLAAGRIHGYISDIPALLYYVKDKPHFKIAERLVTGERYSMVFKKGSKLARQVNDVLTELKNEGFIAKKHEKWFGVMPENTTSTVLVLDMPVAH